MQLCFLEGKYWNLGGKEAEEQRKATEAPRDQIIVQFWFPVHGTASAAGSLSPAGAPSGKLCVGVRRSQKIWVTAWAVGREKICMCELA